MSESTLLLEQTLKRAGQSNTLARRLVFAALEQPAPQTMKQLTDKLSPDIDRATVYRVVGLFEELGIVHRIATGWKYKLELSDKFVPHHHHLVCIGCDKVIDIKDEEHINEFITSVTTKFGFVPQHHQFEVEGYCSDCQRAFV